MDVDFDVPGGTMLEGSARRVVLLGPAPTDENDPHRRHSTGQRTLHGTGTSSVSAPPALTDRYQHRERLRCVLFSAGSHRLQVRLQALGGGYAAEFHVPLLAVHPLDDSE
jgi:hypothetical protein